MDVHFLTLETLVDGQQRFRYTAVADDGEQLVPVAYAETHPWGDRYAGIYAVFVTEELRHKGMGTELLSYVVAQEKLRGVRALTLQVKPENEAAVKLYDAAGFVAYAEDDGYRSMTLRIEPPKKARKKKLGLSEDHL